MIERSMVIAALAGCLLAALAPAQDPQGPQLSRADAEDGAGAVDPAEASRNRPASLLPPK
jgi:hypothetical protein